LPLTHVLLAVAILLVVSVITFVYFLNFVPDTDIVRMQLLTLVSFFKKKKNEKKECAPGPGPLRGSSSPVTGL